MQTYLFRIICGAVLSAVVQSFPLRGTVRRLVALSCGCLMVVLTVTPLLHISFDSLTAKIPSVFSSAMPELSDKNEVLLQDLIREQTEDLIEQTAQEQGVDCTASVTLQYDDEIGNYLPYSVRITVCQSIGTLDALKTFVTEELAIPEERQAWIMN